MHLLTPILKRGLFTPRTIAIVDDRQSYSCAKLALGSFFLGRAIRKATAKPNVGLMLPTSGAFPMALMGAWLAKKTPVPLNYLLRPEELAYVIKDAGLDTILTAQPLLDAIGGRENVPTDVQIVLIEDLVKTFKGIPPLRLIPKAKDDDVAVLLYTSGTSGKPKGVMLTHGNLRANIRQIDAHVKGIEIGTFLGVLPQFHSFGLTALTLWPLTNGHKVVYTARFMPKKIHGLIKEHRPTVYVAVPTMYNAMLSLKKAEKEDFASLTLPLSGGEPLPAAVRDGLRDSLGVELMEGYGLTETSPCTNVNLPNANRPGSVGRALPGVSIHIVDEQLKPLPANSEGEVLIAGDNVMKGYFNLPDETAAVFCEIDTDSGKVRCFRSGDIGKLDDEGFLYITGRKKEMLIVSGENVFPREIEEVLNQHEHISASAVIGVQDDSRGEVPIAFVELVEGVTAEQFDEGAVKAYVRERIAPFKVPREVRVIEQLPRNPTGKIMRRQLQA